MPYLNILGILPEKVTELIKKFIDSPECLDKSFSSQIELKPNRELVVEVTCSPVPNHDKSLAGIVTVVNNISEMKKIVNDY